MGKTLIEIAQELKEFKIKRNTKEANLKIQLIYAFNGTGKTRLSREFKEITNPKNDEDSGFKNKKLLYYNAFTEDLFYWDNDLENDLNPKLRIYENIFTKWLFVDQGQDRNVATNFQNYTKRSLTPQFSSDFREVTFSYEHGDSQRLDNIKISKGEESCFIWSIFYTFIKEVISVLDVFEISNRETDEFDNLEYVFIDDPVTSLDDNHLIELAVNLAEKIKKSKSELKFIITTHNPLFFNVLSNEFSNSKNIDGYKPKQFQKYNLRKLEDGTYLLNIQENDNPFSYHLFLKNEIEKAIESNSLKKYHFNFLRNIIEKTATFLGYENSVELFPKAHDGKPDPFVNRIINLSSHSKHSGDEVAELSSNEKEELNRIFEYLIKNYRFGKGELNG